MQKSQQTLLTSDGLAESQAGDVLLLPIALLAFWTVAYDFVLVVRWPAETITWFFLAIAVSGFFLLRRLWKKTNATFGKAYQFHLSQILLLVLGFAYAITALFVRRPNQDDVFYFHRALSQLSALNQPIFLRQTGVDMDAAALSPVHLASSYEMLMAFLGHYLRIDPLYFYQVVGHIAAAFSLPFVLYWCARRFGLDRWSAAIGSLLGAAFPRIAGQSLASINIAGTYGFATVSGCMWQGKPIVWILFLPVGLALSSRFLCWANASDLIWIVLL